MQIAVATLEKITALSTFTEDKHIEIKFYDRNQVDDKIMCRLGDGFYLFILVLHTIGPPFSLLL